MKKCKICGRESLAKDLCKNHYSQLIQYGKIKLHLPQPKRLTHKKCKIKNCDREHYAKEYCRKHYYYYLGIPRKYGHQHKCNVKECKVLTWYKYCSFHKNRLKAGLPLDNKKYSPKGKRNVNWKGGTSEYPNHYLMKKNRVIILTKYSICQECKKNSSIEIHHRNGDKSDHKLENLMAVCHRCNAKLSSRYYLKYGLTTKEIAKKLHFTDLKIYKLDKENKIKDLLNNA